MPVVGALQNQAVVSTFQFRAGGGDESYFGEVRCDSRVCPGVGITGRRSKQEKVTKAAGACPRDLTPGLGHGLPLVIAPMHPLLDQRMVGKRCRTPVRGR